jgi:hypothetical protein
MISFENLELALKVKILVFIYEKNSSLFMRQVSMCLPFGFQYDDFSYVFSFWQKPAFVCEFQHTPLRKMIIFNMFHTSSGYESLETCT